MSQKLTMSRVLQKLLDRCNGCRNVGSDNYLPRGISMTGGIKSRKVFINGLCIGMLLAAGQVNAEKIEFVWNGPFRPEPQQLLSEEQLNRIGSGVELLSFVPVLGEPMSKPDPQAKSTYRPDERNEGRIGVEQQNKLTPDDTHRFWRLLLIQLSVFTVVFPVVVYISMRANLRREWRKHIPKGGRLKVPTLGMISILCISRRIKPRGWQIWEQRHWFRDMQACHGIKVAYRDTWYWKKIIAEKW